MKLSEYRAQKNKTLVGVANELMQFAKNNGLNLNVTDTTIQRWERGENMPHIDWWPIIKEWSDNAITVSDLQEAYLEHKQAQS